MTYFLINNAHIMLATLENLHSQALIPSNSQANLPANAPTLPTVPTHLGSIACRQLLFVLQKKLNLTANNQPIFLYEQQYPYYFLVDKQRYGVSFSHSRGQVAVMVVPIFSGSEPSYLANNLVPKFGIDVEDKPISDAVARRFFCQQEWQWLDSLTPTQKTSAKTLLWTLKESLIKAHVNGQLVAGLATNLLDVMSKTHLTQLLCTDSNVFNQVIVENQVFGFSSTLNCGFVVMS